MGEGLSRRTRLIAAGTLAGVAALGLAGWAGAAALHPQAAPSTDGRVLQIRYEVRREPAYVPPPPTEATRLDTLSAVGATVVDDGVLSAQGGQAWRSLQAEEDARNAAAVASARAEDARIDRELAAAMPRFADDPAEQARPAGLAEDPNPN